MTISPGFKEKRARSGDPAEPPAKRPGVDKPNTGPGAPRSPALAGEGSSLGELCAITMNADAGGRAAASTLFSAGVAADVETATAADVAAAVVEQPAIRPTPPSMNTLAYLDFSSTLSPEDARALEAKYFTTTGLLRGLDIKPRFSVIATVQDFVLTPDGQVVLAEQREAARKSEKKRSPAFAEARRAAAAALRTRLDECLVVARAEHAIFVEQYGADRRRERHPPPSDYPAITPTPTPTPVSTQPPALVAEPATQRAVLAFFDFMNGMPDQDRVALRRRMITNKKLIETLGLERSVSALHLSRDYGLHSSAQTMRGRLRLALTPAVVPPSEVPQVPQSPRSRQLPHEEVAFAVTTLLQRVVAEGRALLQIDPLYAVALALRTAPGIKERPAYLLKLAALVAEYVALDPVGAARHSLQQRMEKFALQEIQNGPKYNGQRLLVLNSVSRARNDYVTGLTGAEQASEAVAEIAEIPRTTIEVKPDPIDHFEPRDRTIDLTQRLAVDTPRYLLADADGNAVKLKLIDPEKFSCYTGPFARASRHPGRLAGAALQEAKKEQKDFERGLAAQINAFIAADGTDDLRRVCGQNVFVAESQIAEAGYGLYAASDMPTGTVFGVYQGELVQLESARHKQLIAEFSADGLDGESHFNRYSFDLVDGETSICGTPGLGGYASYANGADAPGGSLAGRGPKHRLRKAGLQVEANAVPFRFDRNLVLYITKKAVPKDAELYVEYQSGYWADAAARETHVEVSDDEDAG